LASNPFFCRVNPLGWGGLYSDILKGIPHLTFFEERKAKMKEREMEKQREEL